MPFFVKIPLRQTHFERVLVLKIPYIFIIRCWVKNEIFTTIGVEIWIFIMVWNIMNNNIFLHTKMENEPIMLIYSPSFCVPSYHSNKHFHHLYISWIIEFSGTQNLYEHSGIIRMCYTWKKSSVLNKHYHIVIGL